MQAGKFICTNAVVISGIRYAVVIMLINLKNNYSTLNNEIQLKLDSQNEYIAEL